MAVPDGSVKMGLKEEEIMWMLFREDLQGDDHFDGSEEEVQVFQGVFGSNGVDSLSDFGNVVGTEGSVRAASVQCRIIESFGDGFLCSYNVRCLLPCSDAVSEDGTGELLVPTMAISEIEPDKTRTVNQTDLIEAAAQGTSGIADKQLPSTPLSLEVGQRNEPGTGTGICSGTLDISKIDNPSLKDLCNHLRAHANRLLSDCGYKLEVRRRKDDPKKRCQLLYRLPNNGPVIPHLPKSWISVGKLLQSSSSRSAFDKTHSPGRQWADINEFASDLLKTLTYVEKMLIDPDCGLTLSDQWFLLDPFMAVAWVERKIGQLKKAVPLKAVQNTASVLEENEKIFLQRKSVTNPLTYSRRRCKRSLLPELLALEGANRPMVESQIAPTEGLMTVSGNKSVVSTIVAGEEVPSASDLHMGPCSTEVEVHTVTRLQASSVTTDEQMQCTSEFHVIADKLSKVPPTTAGDVVQDATQLPASQVTDGDHEALHAADFGVNQAVVGEDLLSPAELHMNPAKIGDGVPIKKHYGGNSVILADDVSVRGTEMVNQTSQSTMQKSVNSTLEIPFATLRSEFDSIPTGAKFTINQVSESTVPQQPFLIMYPSDVPFPSDRIDTHSQSITEEVQSLIDQASLFQGTLSFDVIGGFQMKEFPVTWAMHKPLQSKLKRKRMPVSKTQENKPQKRSKKNKEMVGLDTKCETHGRKKHVKKVSRFGGHDLLISAIITKKCLKCRKYPRKLLKKKPTPSQHSTDQTVQLGQTNTNSKKRFMRGARTVLRLLIDTGVVYVNRKIQYLNSKGDKVKQGKLTRYGVLCQCCGANFTVSGFQVHASSESGNPGLNLFLGDGTPYVMCLFQAWSMEYKGRGERMRIRDGEIDRNNDMCGLCGDGGELVCCDSCPFSFHESCLPSQQIPEDCWHCPSCKCGACQQMIDKLSVFSTSIDYLQCSQCDRRFHDKCMKNKNITTSELPPGSWFCGNHCQQLYAVTGRVGELYWGWILFQHSKM